MKELIPRDPYGVFADSHDVALVDSRYVAKYFEKNHAHVLRDIEKLDCSDSFRQSNFGLTSYKDEQGKKRPCYYMTRDGFVFLAMGYRGKKAAKFKELYIRRFNEMGQFIQMLVATRKEFPLLTENIKLLHENPKPYHFSNECDMINRIVTGMSARQFRKEHGIEKGKSIRPYLSNTQIQLMETLQRVDIGLLVSGLSFQERKSKLKEYAKRYCTKEKACIPVAAGIHAWNYVTA